jgi:hypothetical protein
MRLFLRNGPLRENNGPLKVLLTITVRHFTGSDACHIINNCKPLVLYNKNYTFSINFIDFVHVFFIKRKSFYASKLGRIQA